MYRFVVFMCLYLVGSCNSHMDLFEGSDCSMDGVKGVCVKIGICQSALDGLRHEKFPLTCSFSGDEPVVCCFDKGVTTEAVTTTEASTSTSLVPPQPPLTIPRDGTDMKFLGLDNTKEVTTVSVETEGCPPISPNSTAAKTGQKAWDKCLEYQEQLVFPCDPDQRKRYNYCRSDLNTWILGGEDAFEGEFPHMALVGYGTDPQDLQFLCGGSLVSDRFVLTAGHCASARNIGPISYVLLGVLKKSNWSSSNLHQVRAVHKHPNYKPPMKYNDIALLELESPVKLTDMLVPACLDVGEGEEEVALATGWGNTAFGGSSADILQKVELTRFTDMECAARYMPSRLMRAGFNSNSQICYGDRTMVKDTCQGDSGGPLQVRHKKIYCMFTVIGVTSFGRSCGVPGEPALYTRVAHYLPWLEGLVWPDTQ